MKNSVKYLLPLITALSLAWPIPGHAADESAGEAKSPLGEAMAAGDWNRALVLVREKLAAEPNSPTLNLWHADILEALDRYEDAIAVYRQMPDGPIVWEGLCRDLIQVQRLDDAQAACERSIAHEKDFRGYLHLGHVHLLRGDQQSAYRWYGEAIIRMRETTSLEETVFKDLDRFIARGWNVKAAQEARAWYASSYAEVSKVSEASSAAFAMVKRKEYAKAQKVFREFLAAIEPVLGQNNSLVGLIVWGIAKTDEAMGRAEEEANFWRALD